MFFTHGYDQKKRRGSLSWPFTHILPLMLACENTLGENGHAILQRVSASSLHQTKWYKVKDWRFKEWGIKGLDPVTLDRTLSTASRALSTETGDGSGVL